MQADKQIDDAILKLHSRGLSYTSIQNILKVGPNRISLVIHGKQLDHKRGRKAKVTPPIRNFVDIQTMANARVSNEKMREMINNEFNVNISLRSVASTRKQLGFNYRPPMKIQKLTEEQISQRLQFAQFAQKELRDKVIVFSDESRFGILPDNSWIYVKKGKWNETCLQENSKFVETIMFWGAIGPDYKSNLILCSNGMDGNEYVSILERSQLVQTCDMKCGKYGWFFMQDGAPCHNSQVSLDYLYSRVKVVPGWPPNSPDMNPIEMIWAIVKKKLNKQKSIQRKT